MSRAFLKLHYDLLKNPEYQRFMGTPANVTYTLMLSHLYRPNRDSWSNHPLLAFYEFGWLVTDVTVRQLAKEQPGRSVGAIHRDIRRLEAMELLHGYALDEGQRRIYVLGRWGYVEDDARVGRGRTRDRWEFLYVDRIFGGLEVPWG